MKKTTISIRDGNSNVLLKLSGFEFDALGITLVVHQALGERKGIFKTVKGYAVSEPMTGHRVVGWEDTRESAMDAAIGKITIEGAEKTKAIISRMTQS